MFASTGRLVQILSEAGDFFVPPTLTLRSDPWRYGLPTLFCVCFEFSLHIQRINDLLLLCSIVAILKDSVGKSRAMNARRVVSCSRRMLLVRSTMRRERSSGSVNVFDKEEKAAENIYIKVRSSSLLSIHSADLIATMETLKKNAGNDSTVSHSIFLCLSLVLALKSTSPI